LQNALTTNLKRFFACLKHRDQVCLVVCRQELVSLRQIEYRYECRSISLKTAHSGKPHTIKRLLHSATSRQGRTRVSARAAAWIQHASCTHPIAESRDRSRIVGRQTYSARRLYQMYSARRLYHPRGCQSVSCSRSHWCSKTKAMPDRQRHRVPKKLSPSPNPGTAHRMNHSYCAQSSSGGHVYH
jgi:hypothetical protein